MKYAENVSLSLSSLSLLPNATRARSAAATVADVAVGRRPAVVIDSCSFYDICSALPTSSFSWIRSEIRERLRVFPGRVSVALFVASPSLVSFLTLECTREGRSEAGRH